MHPCGHGNGVHRQLQLANCACPASAVPRLAGAFNFKESSHAQPKAVGISIRESEGDPSKAAPFYSLVLRKTNTAINSPAVSSDDMPLPLKTKDGMDIIVRELEHVRPDLMKVAVARYCKLAASVGRAIEAAGEEVGEAEAGPSKLRKKSYKRKHPVDHHVAKPKAGHGVHTRRGEEEM